MFRQKYVQIERIVVIVDSSFNPGVFVISCAKYFVIWEYLTDVQHIKILLWIWLQCLNLEFYALPVLHFSRVLYHNDSMSIVSAYTYLGDM